MKLVSILLTLSLPALADEALGTVHGMVTLEGKARDTVVYVEKASKRARGGKTATVTQKDSSFVPDVLVVRVGDPVDFPNVDKVFHNAFSLTPGNDFDLGLYRGGQSNQVTFRQPGEVDVFCNIHPEMAAKVLVLQNDYFVRPEATGAYKLSLPPGQYTLVAWTPDHQPDKQSITIAAGADVAADFSLKARPGTPQHLNKNGEQYGRYK
jgi:plastocyanin